MQEISELDPKNWCQEFGLPEDKTSSIQLNLAKMCELIFPDDMTGKSLLDVGARNGLFCFEAVKRGAIQVVGLESSAENISQARELVKNLNLPVEFQQLDVEMACPSETYDDVICLNLLCHVQDPFLLLDRLIDMAKERLVLEVSTIGQDEQKKLKLNWWRRLLFLGLRGLPVVFVNPNSNLRNRQKYHLTVYAVHCLLTAQRQVFSRVEVLPSPINGRQILIAHKRRIANLIIIAGPTSAGKSTLIEKLYNNQLPEVLDSLGTSDISTWEEMDPYRIARDDRTEISQVIMHYDFLTRLKWNAEHSQMTGLLDIVSCAQNVTILTIWTEPAQLQRQFEENEIDEYKRQRGCETKNKKTLQLREDYKEPRKIIEYYKKWFAFATTITSKHLVYSQSLENHFMSLEDWQCMCGIDSIHELV